MVPNKKTILSLENIEKCYYKKIVLNGFSAKAEAGDRILITGPNGSGKTTLLKIIARLLIPDKGQVFASQNLSYLPTTESGLWARLTGFESLRLYARLWKISDVQLNQLIESWSPWPAFQESLSVPTQNLSTGRRQLLHFARLLLSRPDLILMDEPFRSLDPGNREFVIQQFQSWSPQAVVIWTSPQPLPAEQSFPSSMVWNMKEIS